MELVALLLLLLLREGLNCERLQVPIHKIIPKEDAPGTRLRPSEKTKRGVIRTFRFLRGQRDRKDASWVGREGASVPITFRWLASQRLIVLN